MTDRIDAGATYVVYDGPPYVYPLAGSIGGQYDEKLASLNLAELIEVCRYWHWRAENSERPRDRWWCAKLLSHAENTLAARGMARKSWQL